MPTLIHDLHDLAYRLGVALTHHTRGPKGLYVHRSRIISTLRGLTVADYKSALAHELGHAYYRDEPTGVDWMDELQERRAERFAARLLIHADELYDLQAWHGEDHASLAFDLEVTPDLLHAYFIR